MESPAAVSWSTPPSPVVDELAAELDLLPLLQRLAMLAALLPHPDGDEYPVDLRRVFDGVMEVRQLAAIAGAVSGMHWSPSNGCYIESAEISLSATGEVLSSELFLTARGAALKVHFQGTPIVTVERQVQQ